MKRLVEFAIATLAQHWLLYSSFEGIPWSLGRLLYNQIETRPEALKLLLKSWPEECGKLNSYVYLRFQLRTQLNFLMDFSIYLRCLDLRASDCSDDECILVSRFVHLKILDLSFNPRITDHGISHLTRSCSLPQPYSHSLNLDALDLSYTNVYQLKKLNSFKNLQILNVTGTKIRLKDVHDQSVFQLVKLQKKKRDDSQFMSEHVAAYIDSCEIHALENKLQKLIQSHSISDDFLVHKRLRKNGSMQYRPIIILRRCEE
jgi:hypothetical protein